MAEKWQLKVEGGPRFRRTLRKAGVDLKDLTKAHREIGAIIVPRARATAPVGPRKGGHIANTIRATAGAHHSTIRAGDKQKPYGSVIHYGWRRRNITGQPWITQAAQATEPEWFGLYTKRINDILAHIKGK